MIDLQPLYDEWHKIILEIEPIMNATVVEHDRIKDCTLKEEWRESCGWSPFDSDMDSDTWKGTYDMFEEGFEDDRPYYRELIAKCGIDDGVLKLKYPRVAKAFGVI